MLSHRIAGILRQYPNPEVAFFTADILTHGEAAHRAWGRGRSTSPYLIATVNYGGGLVTGREQLRQDMESLGLGSVGDYVVSAINEGKWYDDARLDQNTPVDVLAPWVARIVNRWLKTEPSMPPGVAPESIKARLYRAGKGKGWQRTTDIPEGDAIVAHYAALDPLAKHVREIADWTVATHPDLMRLTVNQALHRSRRWHAQFKREKAAAEAPPSDVVFVSGEWSFHALTTRAALEHEGHSQRHCVGGYWRQVAAGETLIFSVRSKKGIVATIEVLPADGRVVQVRGPANRPVVKPDICKAILSFFAYMGFSNMHGYCIPEIVYTEPAENPAGEYTYFGNCVSSTYEDIMALRGSSQSVTWRTFKRHVPEAREFFEQLGAFYEETTERNIEQSPFIAFFRGVHRGRPAYYAVWSGYEWIWEG